MKSFLVVLAVAAAALAQSPNAAVDRLLDHIAGRERAFLERVQQRAPLVETYIQEATSTGSRPDKDHYFLGRFRIGETIAYQPLIERTNPPAKKGSAKNQPLAFLPRGFAQMAFPDLQDFNRQTYSFDYVRREFLGEV